MSTKALAYVLRASLLLLMFVDPWSVGSGQSSKVVVVVEKTERISQNEARLRVKVTNISGKPVFSTGIIHDSWPTRLDVYLEYKTAKEGWQLVGPRHDVPVQEVIRLDPAVPVFEETWLKVPLAGTARRMLPDMKLEGQFRYRVDYFESKTQARLYLKRFFENRHDYPRPAAAFSGPFEIPPFREPPGARPNR
jgi:hypothetical protein